MFNPNQLVPPPNVVGVQAPALPNNPPTANDVMDARNYVKSLRDVRSAGHGPQPSNLLLGAAIRFEHAVAHNSIVPPPAMALSPADRATLNLLEYRMESLFIAGGNKMRVANGDNYCRSLRKLVPGDGTAIANQLIATIPWHVANLAAANPVPLVGDYFLPAHQRVNTHSLTRVQILELIQFYNVDFGIVPTDDIGRMKQKIRNWFCGENVFYVM